MDFIFNQITSKPKPAPSSINLIGQTAVVTGASSGLGLAAAVELAAHGTSRLILGVRSVDKGDGAQARISKESPECKVEVWLLDHEDFDSMQSFAERARILERLDIVILSAGVKQLEFVQAKTGHESNMQINHLGTSLLSLLLLPILKDSAMRYSKPSRLTIVSSQNHFWTPFSEQDAPNTLERLDAEASFKPGQERYSTTKLLNVLWTFQLASVTKPDQVIMNVVNPGFCHTELHRHETSAMVRGLLRLIGWSAVLGGHTLVDAAVVHGSESYGKYLSEQKIKPASNFVLSTKGKETQQRIWHETLDVFKKEAPNVDLGI